MCRHEVDMKDMEVPVMKCLEKQNLKINTVFNQEPEKLLDKNNVFYCKLHSEAAEVYGDICVKNQRGQSYNNQYGM